MAGILYVGLSQPGPEDFGFQVQAPAIAAEAPFSPTLDRYAGVPVATPRSAVIAAEAPPPPSAAALPAPVPVVPVAAPAPRPAEVDPLAEQRHLLQQATAPIVVPVAAPAPNEDVGKLSAMMTSVSALLSDSLKAQIALRREVGQLQADLRSAQADANSRIAFLEAKVSMAATQSVAAGSGQAVSPPAAAPPRPASAPAPRSAASATTYRITGAANNLAYLVAINPAPGQPPAVEAKPGSDVPGYGKVLSISQKGMAWEILTERGTITN
ncbi:hypothetical protein E2C06_12280 [Dankookia rubra]|uniref:Type IV pilus biogenesis protein PilP n=1 Tax=Dankookia rubra TaxID=1442381 RepID=A0A4R5QIF7_9PROT|nr:hypothetical protein [Dankookia rubra]TDH62377.1 hypothetical protein E2C06_12280 [Dankookia rubra]